MADITKCTNELCPAAGECWRRNAPNSEWQSWAGFSYGVGAKGVICGSFWPMYETKSTDKTTDIGS